MTWMIFFGIVAILLFLDLAVFNRTAHSISVKKSMMLSVGYISVALLFGLSVWYSMGLKHATDYYTGYLVELSLSVDNLFIIALIFKYFKVPKSMHHRILFWGILGVIVLRGIMIAGGLALVSRFGWLLYVFAAFLILVGFKMLFAKENKKEFKDHFLFKFFAHHLHPGSKYYFWWIVLMIETADILFAVDSIPAIFAITTNPYIVYTSNIFAIVGLRSLYTSLDVLLGKFIYLQQALALVLIFIGCKVFFHIPSWVSLVVTIGLLSGGVMLSIRKSRGKTSIQS
jgi:tellurite resistance protein TerC